MWRDLQLTSLGEWTSVMTACVGIFVIYWISNWFHSNVLKHIHSTYIYNICLEDPRVDKKILTLDSRDTVYRICSAGDVPLDYVLQGPREVVVSDINPHQLYLLELKVCMLQDPGLTYDEWWGVWGRSDVDIAMRIWYRVRHRMTDRARAWWDTRLETTFRRGFASSGTIGWVFSTSAQWIMYIAGLDPVHPSKQAINRVAWWMRWVYPHLLAGPTGVSISQLTPEMYTVDYYRDIMCAILDSDFSNNYFYHFLLRLGYPSVDCSPRILHPGSFERLRANVHCLTLVHGSVRDVMVRTTNRKFTKIVLLDHMDWLTNADVLDEWAAIQQASVPGALVLWRSAYRTMDHLPFFARLSVDSNLEWYDEDRLKTYKGTFTTRLPEDPFPVFSPLLPRVYTSSARDVGQTVLAAITYPLRTLPGLDHRTRIDTFYKQQSNGYDSTRENLLAARSVLMSSFGPVRVGHEWLDVGGGTGRNIIMLAHMLDSFARIVVVDICESLLAVGRRRAREFLPASAFNKIEWVCEDIAVTRLRPTFDTVTFSYSLSMMPNWTTILQAAGSLCRPGGHILLADFDTCTHLGGGMWDTLRRMWFSRDGVDVSAERRLWMQANMGIRCVHKVMRRVCGVPLYHHVIVADPPSQRI